jgi:hypothetical protein
VVTATYIKDNDENEKELLKLFELSTLKKLQPRALTIKENITNDSSFTRVTTERHDSHNLSLSEQYLKEN